MRKISLKTIFIIFLTILIFVAIYIKFFNKKEIALPEEMLKFDNKETFISNNIRIGIIQFDNINPILSNNKNVQDISRIIFDPLFTLTQDYKLKESLATEYSKLNDTTYIIKLRENVKWQDGNKFDCSDVIFTINMLKKEKKNSIYYYNIANISGLEEIDEYTLKITIDKKIPYFEYNLIFPIISSKYFNGDNFKSESKNIKLPGTGKFYISEVTNNNILLKKNLNGWNNEEINLDSISLNLYDSLSTTINAFKSGEIDIFTTSNIKAEEYLKNTNHNKQDYINRNYDYLILNCNDNVLKNKEIRQAINFAIDKQEIINNIYNGKYRQSNFPLDFGSYVYNKDNIIIAHDKNSAKSLLLDNSWKYSYKKWRKTVNYKYLTIELSLLVNKNNYNLVKVAKNIKHQLESIGILINIIEATDSQYDRYLKNKQYDLILTSNNYSYSPSINKYFNNDNIANYKNVEITKLLNNIENTIDENELKEKYTRITEIYNDEVPYISLYYNTNTMIYSNNLKGTINPNSYNLFYGIETWYREYKK